MRKEKAKRKSRQISVDRTVDSVIVHDMKNLAFRLSALMQNIDENYENPLFKTSMVDVLGDTIRKMNAMVKRFRDNQQQIVVKLRVDVNQILTDILDSLPSRSTRNLERDVNLSELPQIWGDPFYLHNAFSSIIENAIEAMPDGGSLTVKTKSILRGKKAKIHIEISDTGMGMTKAFLQTKLFHPFISTKEQGLGLGLFTCQQIIALHEGDIEVKSAPNAGTLFRIVLPAENNV